MKALVRFLPLLCILSCEVDDQINTPFHLLVPKGFPEVNIPNDNQLTIERINLGKKLFYDPILSRDSSISCNSCHLQEFAFTDANPTSIGIAGRLGKRNAMSLANVAYANFLQRESGVPTLEMQVLVPIQEHNEMDFNIVAVAEKMNEDPYYRRLSYEAYGKLPDAFVITRAIAAFERTFLSGNSKYDTNQLSESEQRGMALFFSDSLACSSCHGTFLFTNQQPKNNGLYAQYTDSGRYILTGLQEDIGRFKTPTLRNIELTSPYMHDGSVNSLEEVIAHYESGGMNHENQSAMLKGFTLTETEREELIEFLNSLTDSEFTQNAFFKK
jgi:cytochrome c peroxidase